MNSLRYLLVLTAAFLLLAAPVTHAATETRTFAVNLDIPDNTDPPTTFSQTISDSVITSLLKVEVGLKLAGTPVGSGFASDIFVSLNKDLTTTSILLNRPGFSTTDTSVGATYDGWDVTFSDGAANGDVHLAALATGILTGLWEPDGRIAATDTARPSLLAQFISGTGNGDWRLSVGDLADGGTMRLESWTLTFTGDSLTPVPEPGTVLAGAFALLILAVTWLKRKRTA